MWYFIFKIADHIEMAVISPHINILFYNLFNMKK